MIMKIELLPRIIDDNQNEVKEKDLVMIQTKDMTEPATAMIIDIQTTLVTVRLLDSVFNNQPFTLRASEIVSLTKTK